MKNHKKIHILPKDLSLGEDCKIKGKVNKKEKVTIKIITLIITIAVLLLISYTLLESEEIKENLSEQIQSYGIPALFIFALILDLIPQIISPVIILTAGILAGISTHTAILITALGSTTGSIIGFDLGRKYACKAVNLLTEEKSLKKVTHMTNKYGKIIVPLAAISPLPYLPVLFGAMNFKRKNFIIYGLIPRAIGLIGYGYLAQLI